MTGTGPQLAGGTGVAGGCLAGGSGVAGGGSPTLPIATGLEIHLEGDSGVTLGSPVPEGAQWVDQSPNAYVFGASGALTAGPTANGVPSVIGIVRNDSLGGDRRFLHDGTEHHIFAVVKFGDGANPNAIRGLFGTCNASTVVPGVFAYYDDRAGSGFNDKIIHTISTGGGSGATAVNNASANDAVTPNTFHLVEITADPANGTAADRAATVIDDGTPIANNTASTAPSAADSQVGLWLNQAGATTFPNTGGALAAFIVYKGSIKTGADRTAIIDYIQTKYGI